mmetsp:Transcript_37552/g.56161  ORF Transcript_37552/g.56161 Transcript_37552/m.56161 type:complete len:630 (-) Transcript_37552:306-2195(-)
MSTSNENSRRRKPRSKTKGKGKATTNDGIEFDPNGTHQISRGQSLKEAKERRNEIKSEKLATMTPAERQTFQSYLHGGTDDGAANHHRKKRRFELQQDDKHGIDQKLTAEQKRVLEKRKRRNPDKKLQWKMERMETKRLEAAVAATDAEVILHTEMEGFVEADNDMEHTSRLTQLTLKRQHLDEQTARNIFDLSLTQYAPYGMRYDRSGRRSIIFGQNRSAGHVAIMDQHTFGLKTEFHLEERIKDGTFLHNNTMFALAQKKNVYIYDDDGTEIHRMTDHTDVNRLEFLPYHWLLATVGQAGWLKYHDTSTGDLISMHRSKLGPCSVMTQNPSNAIVHLGHTNGTVTLWSPASNEPLVKMLCHGGAPIRSLAIDRSGTYMVTGGADSYVRIWDLRMYRQTHSYSVVGGVPCGLDISQRGVLGIGHGSHATFWGPNAIKVKAKEPYMRHEMPGCGPVETLRFRPFEDVCGIGHQKGVSSIVIPGSGEANLDTTEYNINPYQDTRQRREGEVRALLDKLSPDMIALDPGTVGTVESSDPYLRRERIQDLEEEANRRKENEPKKKEKNKMRGRSKIQKKIGRKQKNVIDEQILKLREAREQERKEEKRAKSPGGKNMNKPKDDAPAALKRFF